MTRTIECDVSRSWLIENLDDFRNENGLAKEEVNPSRLQRSEQVVQFDKLYAAAVSGDFEDIKLISHDLKSTNQLHAGVVQAIERLERNWRSDHLSIHQISNAFWTLRRVLEHHATHKTKDQRTSLGQGLIIVRQGEQHSFGAQLLADRLERNHWEIELILDASDQDILNRVEQASYSVMGFSVGCDQNLLGLADLINDIRLRSCDRKSKVLVGGPVFQGPLSQYDFLGADAVCDDSETAMQVFGRIGKYHA